MKSRQDIEAIFAERGGIHEYVATHATRFADLVNIVSMLGSKPKVLDVAGNEFSEAAITQCLECEYTGTGGADVEIDQWASTVGHNKFDIAICTEVIEHMSADPAFLVQQINLALKPGGYLLLTTVNVASFVGIFNLLKGHAPYVMGSLFGDRRDRHQREYAPLELVYLVASNGFDCQMTTRCYYGKTPHRANSEEWVKSNVPEIDERLHNDTIVIVGKKVDSGPPFRLYPVYHKSICENPDGRIPPSVIARSRKHLLDLPAIADLD